MSPPTYAQASTLTDQPTFRAATLAQLAAPAAPLQPAPVAGWSESAPQRLLVEDFAADMAVESKIRAAIASTISPQQAVAAGADWVRACLGWFGEDYIPALPSTWAIPFQVAATSAPLTVDNTTVLQVQATDGQIFLCTQATAVTFNAAGSYQGTLTFVARASGTISTSTASNIQNGKILTGPAGLSLIPTPVNLTAGRDIETPQQAILRCLGKWTRLGAGWTTQAFDYLIPSFAPSVTSWYVDDSNPVGPGSVQVWLADAAAPATTAEVNAVLAGLTAPGVKPIGSGPVSVLKANAHPLTINITVAGDGTNANLAADITAALTTLWQAYPVGPALLVAQVVMAVALGGEFSSLAVIAAGSLPAPGPPFATKEMSLSLPGFSGAAAITALTTSTGGLESPAQAEALAAGDKLVVTLNVTVV